MAGYTKETGILPPLPTSDGGMFEVRTDEGRLRSVRQFDAAGTDITDHALAEAIDQRDRAREVAVALEQQVAAVEAIHYVRAHPGGKRLETIDGEVLSEEFGPEERCSECGTPWPCKTARALSPSDGEDGERE